MRSITTFYYASRASSSSGHSTLRGPSAAWYLKDGEHYEEHRFYRAFHDVTLRDNDEEYYQCNPGGSARTSDRPTGFSPAGAVTGGAQVIVYLQLNSASFSAIAALGSLLGAVSIGD